MAYRKWESSAYGWKDYDSEATQVGGGKHDKIKQSALYVDLSKTGEIRSTPLQITKTQSEEEYERGRRIESSVRNMLEGNANATWDYERIAYGFKALFEKPNAFLES
ncbi:MAG: hypothetical protein ABIH42_02900 [Planctomycetota bacterium]